MSRLAKLTVFGCRHANLNLSLNGNGGVKMVKACLPNKLGLIICGFLSFAAFFNNCKNLVIITEPSLIGILGFISKLMNPRIKWVVDIWDVPFRYRGSSYVQLLRVKITRIIFKLFYRIADLFLVSIVPDFDLKFFDIPESKMLLMKNAIWMNVDKTKNIMVKTNSFNLVCMRSLYTADMGLDVLAHAFIRLIKDIPNISLTIIGEIPKHLEYQVSRLRKFDSVKFTGFIEYDESKNLILQADVCVVPFKDVPDLAQTYPTSILQYFVLGKAIVAARINGISALVQDNYNGLLFEPGNPLDLAYKVKMLYDNRNLLMKLSYNASKSATRYDCYLKNQIIYNKICSLFQK